MPGFWLADNGRGVTQWKSLFHSAPIQQAGACICGSRRIRTERLANDWATTSPYQRKINFTDIRSECWWLCKMVQQCKNKSFLHLKNKTEKKTKQSSHKKYGHKQNSRFCLTRQMFKQNINYATGSWFKISELFLWIDSSTQHKLCWCRRMYAAST